MSYYPWVRGDADDGIARAGVDLNGDVLRSPDGAYGGAVSISTDVELNALLEGAFAGSDSKAMVAAAGSGELGVSLRTTAGLQMLAQEQAWLFTLGLGVRLPAFAGIAVAAPH